MRSLCHILLVGLFLLPNLGNAQEDNPLRTTAMGLATTCTANSQDELPELVTCLLEGAEKTDEQLWRIITWITENIAYDVDKWQDSSKGCKDCVLQYKRGVCSDYADLFRDMCRLATIECHVVEGYAKGWGWASAEEFAVSNHAWNAVVLPDTILMMDLTWAAGSVDKDKVFTKVFDEGLISIDRAEFASTHLPSDPRWQLRSAPIPLHRFEKIANYAQLTEGLKPSYSYRDSIETYRKADLYDRVFLSGHSAYRFNPTHENLDRWLTNVLYHCNLIWQDDPKAKDFERTLKYFQFIQRKAEETPGFPRREYFVKRAKEGIVYARYRLNMK